LDDEQEELFMHYLYELYTMFVPSMIITSEGIAKVLKNWGRIDSLEDFNSYLGWDASWSDKHGEALFAKAVETTNMISASCKVEKVAKSAATRKENRKARGEAPVREPLAEISHNQYVAALKRLPVTKPAKQPARPKCWTVITPQDLQGSTSSSHLGKH